MTRSVRSLGVMIKYTSFKAPTGNYTETDETLGVCCIGVFPEDDLSPLVIDEKSRQSDKTKKYNIWKQLCVKARGEATDKVLLLECHRSMRLYVGCLTPHIQFTFIY